MEAKEEFQVDHLTATPSGTSFSQLLFGDDDDYENHANAFSLPSVDHTLFSFHKPPKMLSFQPNLLLPQTNLTPLLASPPNSSSLHSITAFTSSPKSNNKRNGSGQEAVKQPKKSKAENPTSTGHAKRKEKLGERIAALQQLVSPFGKTDTASVLHEAMGYIRFLHDQVQVLCSPYLQNLPSSCHQHPHGGGENKEVKEDLRSKGLCLIPVGCTIHVADSNGADFWSPAATGNNVSPSAKQ